jgi:hypothetical protein
MDSLKINGSISSRYAMKIDENGFVKGFGVVDTTAPKSLPLLSMIEQRIRDEIEPSAQQAEKDLIAIISIELGKLGINPSLTGTHAYARGIADKYRERLVGERIDALVDFMANIANQP